MIAMQSFLSLDDLSDFQQTVQEAIALKKNPYGFETLGHRKTIGLLFFNPSLRTRLSTQKAAQQLGMQTMVMNFGSEGWNLEFTDGVQMNGNCAEHVKEAAAVVSQYCDIVAIRAFASLKDKELDEQELVLKGFARYASIPVVNMESATGHPLQALADAMTIQEHSPVKRPKVVLTWAPHPRALPHAVANSFTDMMQRMDAEFVIAQPKGYELNPAITKGIDLCYKQEEAFAGADFIYAKNWSSYASYGQVLHQDMEWMVSAEKMALTNQAKFMHCLPVRRNMIVEDVVLDSSSSIVIEQAFNRTYAAQIVLKKILENG